MKPASFRYERPRTVDETVALLAELGDDAKVLAGGQSLVPMLNMRLAAPACLVDVNRIAGLDYVDLVNDVVRVGALTRQSALERSALVRSRLPLVAECLPHVGHFVTRNRGTVGGSIAHADAKAELPLALLALGGSAVASGPGGYRRIRAADLFVTHYTTTLAPDELLVETVWPAARPGWGYAFEEFALRAGDYALAMSACALRVENGRVAEARVGIAGPADRPRESLAGRLLEGWAVNDETARAAAEAAGEEVEPSDTLHASAAYQRHLVGLVVERAVRRAWTRAAAPEVNGR
jgi:CO/xanthine dehydrogenase FAD-binding subunit